jgi:tyrosine-protein kinase Etk/Wzc
VLAELIKADEPVRWIVEDARIFVEREIRRGRTYDVIIMDTPPIGMASETLELLKLVDLTFYLLRYNYSQKLFIEHANQLKAKKGLKNFYAIYNGISEKEMKYGGYGYGYYTDTGEKKPLLERIFGGSRNRAAI